jgi:PAS domain S-box-containing protein
VWHGPENVNTRRSNGRAEERLRETEAEYRALVEQIPAVVYIEDLDGLTTTLYDSPQIERILGYPPDTYKKDPGYWTKILHPDDRARVLEEERRAAARLWPRSPTLRMRRWTRNSTRSWWPAGATTTK